MAILSEKTWQRHSNPLSAWSRALSFVLLPIIIWYLLIAFIIWLIINPLLFPNPKSQSGWMSRAVIGEKIYTASGKVKADLSTALNFTNLVTVLILIYTSYNQMLVATILLTIISYLLKFWYLDKMVYLADSNKHLNNPQI